MNSILSAVCSEGSVGKLSGEWPGELCGGDKAGRSLVGSPSADEESVNLPRAGELRSEPFFEGRHIEVSTLSDDCWDRASDKGGGLRL